MITKIGENAGLVWNSLQNGAQEIKAIKKATKLKNEDLYMALGWLAREGKLNTVVETRCGKDCEYFTL